MYPLLFFGSQTGAVSGIQFYWFYFYFSATIKIQIFFFPSSSEDGG